MRRLTFPRSSAIALGLLLIVLASRWIGGAADGTDVPESIVAQGEERFPMATPGEARSFSNAWAVVQVVGEAVGPTEGGGAELGEGYASRTLELALKSEVWAADSVTRLPSTFTMTVIGYAMIGGKPVPLIYDEAQRMEVGRDYLVGLIVEPKELTLASPHGVLGMQDGVVELPADVRQRGPLLDDFVGLSAQAAGQVLAAAAPAVPDSLGTFEDRLAEYND